MVRPRYGSPTQFNGSWLDTSSCSGPVEDTMCSFLGCARPHRQEQSPARRDPRMQIHPRRVTRGQDQNAQTTKVGTSEPHPPATCHQHRIVKCRIAFTESVPAPLFRGHRQSDSRFVPLTAERPAWMQTLGWEQAQATDDSSGFCEGDLTHLIVCPLRRLTTSTLGPTKASYADAAAATICFAGGRL